jgi:uncharacterized beta-barrel protein YwiB (DUF1934 family)
MQKVTIHLKGTQTDQESQSDIELFTDGTYTHSAKGDSVLSYTESELTGMAGTRTTFRVNPKGVITLTREGSVNTIMTFELGKKQTILYNTPFGAAALGVNARTVKSKLGKNGGKLELEYALDAENLLVGVNKFNITVRPKR